MRCGIHFRVRTPGEGRNLPAQIFDVDHDNLLKRKLKQANFVTFPKIYLKTIWYSKFLFVTLPWPPHLTDNFFSEFEFSSF